MPTRPTAAEHTSPLWLAARFGHTELIEYMLELAARRPREEARPGVGERAREREAPVAREAARVDAGLADELDAQPPAQRRRPGTDAGAPALVPAVAAYLPPRSTAAPGTERAGPSPSRPSRSDHQDH